jgi:hypothetical protein
MKQLHVVHRPLVRNPPFVNLFLYFPPVVCDSIRSLVNRPGG